MTYYSGTSRFWYNGLVKIDEIDGMLGYRKIHCWKGNSTNIGLEGAVGFAFKRARQDNSEPVVIEITKLRDFKIDKSCGYPLLIGLLKEENHRILTIDELVNEGKLDRVYKTMADKLKEEK